MNQMPIHTNGLMTNNWIKLVPDWLACDADITVALACSTAYAVWELLSPLPLLHVGVTSSGHTTVAIKHPVTALIIWGGLQIVTNW